MRNWLGRAALALTLSVGFGLAASSPALAQSEPVIIRKGEGTWRKDLDAMERKPFDAGNWAKLSEWTNGKALTPGDYSGKVVVILTWADWYAPSSRALNMAKRLAEKYSKDGLVTVCAHDKQGWKEAKKPTVDKDVSFLLAYDANGDFRKAIKQDQDPDFFVIDRAGQLRYAAITNESVEPAVEFLLKEKAEDAAGLNARLAAEAKAKDLEQRRTDAIRDKVDLTALPEVPFTMPLPEAYKDVKGWPKMPRDPNSPPEDPKNPDPPIIMNTPDVGFYPSKPNMQGRMILMYFWHPELMESYHDVMPYFDQFQKQHSRDVVVIGVVCPLKGANGQELKLENDPERIQKKLDDFTKHYNLGHTLLVDLSGTLLGTATNKNQNNIALPWVAVISSDNTLRWGGWLGLSAARGAIDKVLAVDPGIQARRKAEEEYLRTKTGK